MWGILNSPRNKQEKGGQRKNSLTAYFYSGTRGGTRTLTVSLPADFESAASTNSATLAWREFHRAAWGFLSIFLSHHTHGASTFAQLSPSKDVHDAAWFHRQCPGHYCRFRVGVLAPVPFSGAYPNHCVSRPRAVRPAYRHPDGAQGRQHPYRHLLDPAGRHYRGTAAARHPLRTARQPVQGHYQIRERPVHRWSDHRLAHLLHRCHGHCRLAGGRHSRQHDHPLYQGHS